MTDEPCRCDLVRGNLVIHPDCPHHIAAAPMEAVDAVLNRVFESAGMHMVVSFGADAARRHPNKH